ncbi:hypothetical protein F5J12DRAFT_928661 [Pisolithus orientalis]|uniref:uncharacterized protein n=1 Tax=Pisolithus orientalis TaxID=936130 RepID=UPI0022240EAA|nr:uncharacterized protein F5J12DRAFT_928661 [Pisolithus orientalis]KAI5999846.1 hypothetical protein F5J12DRAFT_928661 [Pisolithus orientalis]
MPMVEHHPGGKGLPHKPHDGGFSSCNGPSSSAEVKAETTGVLAEMYGILESSTHTVFNLQHESKSQLNHKALLLLDVARAQCKVFCAEQALATCITHEYESMAKLYKYKAGSGKVAIGLWIAGITGVTYSGAMSCLDAGHYFGQVGCSLLWHYELLGCLTLLWTNMELCKYYGQL